MLRITGVYIFLILFGVVAVGSGIYVAKEDCPSNEEYLLCGSACPFNCTDPKEPVSCGDDCIEGCFCKSGFLRDENGTCVSSDQCIGKEPSSICSENEEFLSCGTACPLTCTEPEPLVCGLACSMGCFCKGGFVRDTTSNKCVKLEQCPPEQCINQNEIYNICNAGCEPSCTLPEPFCAQVCIGGCICSPGLLRNDNGDCVSVDKCPSTNGTDAGVLGKYLNAINKILNL